MPYPVRVTRCPFSWKPVNKVFLLRLKWGASIDPFERFAGHGLKMCRGFIPISPQGDGNASIHPKALSLVESFIPISPQGDGNQHHLVLFLQLPVLPCFIPISPQGDGNWFLPVRLRLHQDLLFHTHFPARGRKPYQCHQGFSATSSGFCFIPISPQGDGNEIFRFISQWEFGSFIPISPQGDGNLIAQKWFPTASLILFHTHFPARGRKLYEHRQFPLNRFPICFHPKHPARGRKLGCHHIGNVVGLNPFTPNTP